MGQIRAERLEKCPFKEFAILIVALATLIVARQSVQIRWRPGEKYEEGTS
jgi:hypothetical protein